MPTLPRNIRAQRWKAHDRRRHGFYGFATNEARAYLQAEAERAAEAVRNTLGPGQAVEAGVQALQGLGAARGAVEDIARRVVARFGREEWSRLTSRFKAEEEAPVDEWFRRVSEWLRGPAGDKIQGIADTTRQTIQQLLVEGAEEGLGSEAMARQMSERIESINLSRARVIARTEVINASNQGSFYGARAAAQRFNQQLEKQWLDSNDDRVRDTHEGVDGQTKPMDQPFVLPDGDKLMWPGDTSLGAKASNTIQCRCTQTHEPVDSIISDLIG